MCDHDRATEMSNSDGFHVKHPSLHHLRRHVRTWRGSSIARVIVMEGARGPDTDGGRVVRRSHLGALGV